MFCKKCGTEVPESAKFCSGCGAPTSEKTQPKYNLTTPIMVAKPVFILWVAIVSVIPIQLFMTVWAAGFFGGFSLFGILFFSLNIPVWLAFVFFGALAFFGIPFFSVYSKMKTYERAEYKFFADRLEYSEGFWTVENKTIKYKNITETNLRKGVIQKKYGLGTIILSTPATGIQQGRAMSGINIADIEKTEEIYEKLQKLMQ